MGPGPTAGDGDLGGWARVRGRGTDSSLACNSAGDANADTKSAADVSRFHTVYDGSSGLRYLSRKSAGPACALGLLSTLNRSKVNRFRVATRILLARVRRWCARSWR